MLSDSLLCLIPAERAHLSEAILAAGATPVIDITCSKRVPIPAGAWVRVRTRRSVPGTGPVILSGEHSKPVKGRATWLEVTTAAAPPEGFAGVLLRGAEAGGPCAARPGMALLSALPEGTPAILEAGCGPEEAAAALAAGATAVVLSDVLLAQPAMALPARLATRVERAGPGTDHRINGHRIQAAALSPILRTLLSGADFWETADGWLSADAPDSVAFPAGTAVALGRQLAALCPSIEELIARYQAAVEAPKAEAPKAEPPVEVAPAASAEPPAAPPTDDAVAIIGMGCRMPDADDIETFWANILAGRSAITEVPSDRWEPGLFWSEDRSIPDKTYSKIGGFLRGFTFNSRRFRIPPMVAKMVDPVQQIALESVADALDDAGYGDDRDYDRGRVAVILGNSMGGEFTDDYAVRARLPAIVAALKSSPDFAALPELQRAAILASFQQSAVAGLPPITEDSMPGELANVIAGRIANAFDLTGPNFTVDAACASSMAAIQTAVRGLLAHEFDLAVTGGADRSMGVPTYAKFSKIGALSARHSAPFDAAADGFVMGEGCGVLVLKRLSQAAADGDRIYAVIRGIGGSSDGRGKGIMAPNPRGQKLALQRAYSRAGISPADVDLIECHGTSTVVGDKVEIDCLAEVIGPDARTADDPIRVGSVKSNIGHLKSAAGAASTIKAALALYHRTLPPSINFENARADVPLDSVPLKVQDRAEPWQTGRRRRAGVSAFGFGGVNFHVVLEEHSAGDPVPAVVETSALPEGVWGTSAADEAGILAAVQADPMPPFSPSAPMRLVGADAEPLEKQTKRVIDTLSRGRNPGVLRARGIHMESGRYPGKIAFLFTGQGSQYIGMGLDLAAEYPIVAETFAEADAVLADELPNPLSSYIRRDESLAESEQFAALRATEIAQPATLTVDVAILRLLTSFGIHPDMVAGHSLGEYSAAVAAGMMSFPDALIAVSARGREMAAVKIDDPGKMAGIATREEKINEVLEGIDGYVIAANKNCPTQTVIAGESAAVEAAMALFKESGVSVHPIPVSHAFHSAIVAPASEPFGRVLARLDVRPPRRPITTNVDASYYNGRTSADIVDNLARQIASPVEWIKQVERMYEDGARIFVECGPKRALTGFVTTILRRQEHRAIYTNHPKRGGVASFREALAAFLALGVPVRARPGSADLFADLEAGPAAPAALPAPAAPSAEAAPALAMLSALTEGAVRGGLNAGDAAGFVQQITPALQGLVEAIGKAFADNAPKPEPARPAPAPAAPPAAVVAGGETMLAMQEVVCSGASLGLPGGEEVFGPDNFDRILSGENRISLLSEEMQDKLLAKNIVRLQKDSRTGQGEFQPVEHREQVIRLAGVASYFDLEEQYDVNARRVAALDITTKLAFAAGLEAMRDAGLPIVQLFRETSTGKRIADRWALPEPLRAGTGIIFASAFPGYDNFAQHMATNGDDGEGRFDRRFLFQVLSMGHSQFAELIGARGPNTQINSACASTTQAVGIASDWVRTGRADRVIIIAADDVTSPRMLEWIGAGFLASGAATTEDRVEEAALPFDRRRHGMILGMGAVGLVIERADAVAERGMTPIARLLAARFGNSAFHGSRLHPTHISEEMDALVGDATKNAGVSREDFARQAVFMSHETFTPAKGGSAAAEISSLRQAFGGAANQVLIANTKGFTGHAMGAGLEDAIVVKALQTGKVPPVPNLREPDPDLGDLRLSPGGTFPIRYAIRLAAGFGSQLALLAWEKQADAGERKAHPATYERWINDVSGLSRPTLEVRKRTLRLIEGEPVEEAPAAPAAPAKPAQSAPTDVLPRVLAVVAEKTGYGVEELDPDYELEADLGIDTVKQAEIFGVIRDRFGLEQDDSFKLADYPTIRALAGWVAGQVGAAGTEAPAEAPAPAPEPTPAPAAAPPTPAADTALPVVLEIISEKTGYGIEELDPDYELEADLGVDTVKQAEIFGLVRERYGLEQDDEFNLADYPTIRALAGWVSETVGSAAPAGEPAEAPAERGGRLTQWVSDTLPDEDLPRLDTDLPVEDSAESPAADVADVLPTLLAIVSEKTGYGIEELDPDYELEADLGVDTVKQAEIFGSVREKLGLEQDDSFNLADHPTIAGLAGYLAGQLSAGAPAPAASEPAAVEEPVAEEPVAEEPIEEDSSEEVPGPFDSPTPLNLETVDDPHGLPEPRSIEKSRDPDVLPDSFRIRRPVLVESPAWAIGSLSGRCVQVLGAGPLAASLKAELKRRGAVTSGRPDAVIDADADVIRSFHAARSMDSDRPSDWVCASLIGADPTVVPAEIAVRIGARAGFTKALNREWPECAARLVDVHPSLSDPEAARILCDELAARDGAVEIFHHGGRRLTMALQLEPLPTSGQPITDNPVIVLTGGTRGITARVALEFAQRGPCRLALLARTAPAGEPLDEATTRAEIRAALKESGHRGTPAEIEQRMKPLRSADEVRQNIAQLTAAGAEVMFISVDLSDPVTIHGALERVRTQWGRIDGVVHGAGAEESRLIPDKDEKAFRRIFDGKALGGLALAESLREHTWLVSMGSVAGRFGNPGQVDYAAANEAMARVCLGRPRSLHVDWTAWGDVGMASRGGMDTLLVSRGIELLPATPGAALLVDMVLEEMWGEKVVAGRLGDMTSACDHPLLDTLRYEGDGVIAERLLSLASDPWIADHAISGVPVLPGVIGLEMMAAVATRCRPGRTYCGAREVTFSAPVKLFRDDPTRVIVHATPEGPTTIRCTLSSQRTAKTGRVLTTEHFSALIELRAEVSPEPLPPAIAFDTRISQGEIYQRFFHGPIFQVLESASGLTADGLEGEILVDHSLLRGGLITAPLILEAAFQAAGLHRMVIDGELALPSSIGQVHLVSTPADGAPLWALVRRRGDRYDIDVSSGSAPVMRIRDFEMIATGPLPPEGRFEVPEGGWPAAIIAQASFEAPPSRLPASEEAALTARGTPRRQRDRIAGRLAARSAVRALTGAEDHDFTIDNDPLGRPRVDLPRDVRISITHRSGEALAVAASGGWPGIDVERIEPRDPAFAETWFTPAERMLAGSDPFRQTLIWATKEAVLKALGTGLRLSASEVEVTDIAPGRLSVRLGVAACWRVAYLDGQPPTVRWSRQGDDVIVTAFVADASLSVAFAAA